MIATGRAGSWEVVVTPTRAVAINTRTGVQSTTVVQMFPVGYRVGRVWTKPVTKAVVTEANRQARAL